MATWDSADLLARSKALLNRPSTDDALSDAQWYTFLTEAQFYYYSIFAARCPEVLYGAPTLLTSADSGQTYTFGSGVFPIGKVEIREKRSGYVLRPGAEWDEGADYTFEGDRIRIPGGRSRTFSAGPYARFITPPDVISAATAPTLKPPFARILLVHHACGLAAIRLSIDPNPYAALEAQSFNTVMEAIRTQDWQHGQEAFPVEAGAWWRSGDLR